jgi:hypothetical protein
MGCGARDEFFQERTSCLCAEEARKELHAFAKKRKALSPEDKDKGRVGSLHNLEAGKIDLAAFNYSEMDDLKIDSDDNSVKSTKDKSKVSV